MARCVSALSRITWLLSASDHQPNQKHRLLIAKELYSANSKLAGAMAILPGRRLGPYEILTAIGAGGMGEVYQARDPKLGRDVAIKVLREAFAHDADRLGRFQREAKMLASLNEDARQ